MKFRSLIFKNISRNKSRSALTIFGIAIGVAAVIGLGLLTEGLPSSTQNALTAGAADFSVIAKTNNAGGELGGPGGMGEQQLINQDYISQIQKIFGVNSAVGVLRTMTDLDNSSTSNSSTSNSSSQNSLGDFRSMTTLIGIDKNSISMDDIVITNGTVFSGENEVIIGKTAAERSNKTIGDTISISNQTFQIVGVYETGNFQDDSGIVMSLDKLQNLTGNTGKISLILVKADNGTDTSKLATTIGNKYSNELTTSTSLSGMDRMNQGLEVINTAVWGISLLAILIGGIITVITMMKAVSERTREIGVLRAIGWTKNRIIKMIIGESIFLSLIAIIIGIIVGIGVVEILSLTRMIPGISPSYSNLLFLKGLFVALLLGILGGIYPAYKASKLEPTEALRYE